MKTSVILEDGRELHFDKFGLSGTVLGSMVDTLINEIERMQVDKMRERRAVRMSDYSPERMENLRQWMQGEFKPFVWVARDARARHLFPEEWDKEYHKRLVDGSDPRTWRYDCAGRLRDGNGVLVARQPKRQENPRSVDLWGKK